MSTKSLGALLIITSSFFYASYGVWTVLMGDFFGGYTASGLRSLVVLAILVLLAYWLKGFEPLAWQQNWRRLLGMVLVSMLVWGPLYWSVLEVGIGMALSVNYSAIVIGFLFFGWLLVKESLSKIKLLSAALGILGLFLVFVPTVSGMVAFLPLAAALVSGLAISVNTIWAKQLTYDTTQSTLFLWATSVLANLPLAFILQEPMPIFEFRAEWVYLVLFGVASVLSSWLLLRGMKYIEAGLAGILGLLEIVFGVAFGILLFNEQLEPVAWLGIGLILAAASLPYLLQKREMEVDLSDLELAVQKSWSAQSSFLPEQWSSDNPARGQCAVTTLVVQDYLGGEMIKCDVIGDNDSHFYNKLPDGTIVDLTRSQFDEGVSFESEKVADRKKMLSYPGTQERYDLLKAVVSANL